jgi:dGTPase
MNRTIESGKLTPGAADERSGKGRRFPEPAPKYRGEYQRDRDRIIHSTAFRRLVYKTQVFVNHEGDLYRTRLTHSLEVAQIARTVARALGLNETLVEAVSLAHDLGHTPFGHAGQDMLNACMRDYGGFEHNLQSLRVVDELEHRYPEFQGLNLTYETREGILKHCSDRNARGLGELGRRFLERRQPGLEAQLANLADAVAYNNHDVDDGYRAGLLTLEQLHEQPLFGGAMERVKQEYPKLEDRRLVYEVIRRMIGRLVTDLIETTRAGLEAVDPESIEDVRSQPGPIVRFSAAVFDQHTTLKRFLYRNLYRHEKVRVMTDRAKETVKFLFDRYFAEPGEMGADFSVAALAAGNDEPRRARVVADYIAGMTDRFAIREHQRLA